MAFEKILVLDDELIIRKSLQQQLQKKRYTVATAATIKAANRYLQRDQFELVFMDLRLPDGDGTELLRTIMKKQDPTLVVMMTGYASVESAVNCMRAGAFDYLIKPFSINQIEMVIRKAETYSHLVKVNRFYSQGDDERSELMGSSRAIGNVRKLIRKVAPKKATVLIQGESGTGKELIASEIHKASRRGGAPFIKVNCASVSETLIESEFFGHEKGAFTGADRRHEGRFELADGGTILLDEVSEISPALQAKLLRVLQESEFERVGGSKTIRVDVRVIATTNRDLAKCVQKGVFREDLYYRLNVFPIVNPPLRERREDIPMLAKHFEERLSRQHGVKIRGIAEEANECLVAHDWPGNIRELKNLIERVVILSEDGDVIEPAALGLVSRRGSEAEKSAGFLRQNSGLNGIAVGSERMSLDSGDLSVPTMEEMQRRHIFYSLELTGGNRTHAAKLLKISSRTLRNKLKQYRFQENA